MMIDDLHTKEGNSLELTKMCSLENGLWLLRYAERLTPKMIKRWSRKTATNVRKKINPTNQGGTLREKERY